MLLVYANSLTYRQWVEQEYDSGFECRSPPSVPSPDLAPPVAIGAYEQRVQWRLRFLGISRQKMSAGWESIGKTTTRRKSRKKKSARIVSSGANL